MTEDKNDDKNKMKRILNVAVVAMALVILSGAVVLSVQAATAAVSQDMVLRVDGTGKVLLRGTVTAISGGVFTVKSWGGEWIVDTDANTQALPNITGNDLANFQVGDYIGAQGMVRQDANWTMDAALVRDWTYRANMAAEQKQNRQAATQTIRSESPKNYAGVASGLSGDVFTLVMASGTLSVDVAPDAQIVNRNWILLPLASVTNGDAMRVWGVNASGTIMAKIVRDLSIPATSTPPQQ